MRELIEVMARLRDPNDGCPWDLEQDHHSLRKNMIEEAYEAVDAIERNDVAGLREELGDCLLQIVFHAQIAREAGEFDIDEVAAGIVAKLKHRHPHIFGDAEVHSADEVLGRWEQLKAQERGEAGLLDSIPSALPALLEAQKLSRRAVSVGFEWETMEDVWAKVHEEIDELLATDPGTPEAADELGDVIFTLVNVARKMGIDAETALRGTNTKFRSRFGHMERGLAEAETPLGTVGIDVLEAAWQRAKADEHAGDQDS